MSVASSLDHLSSDDNKTKAILEKLVLDTNADVRGNARAGLLVVTERINALAVKVDTHEPAGSVQPPEPAPTPVHPPTDTLSPHPTVP